MSRRTRFRIGRHLVRDDESGITYYDDQVVKRWDGQLVHKDKGNETRHPQEFVRAKSDPKALKRIRTDIPWPTPINTVPVLVGETNVPAPYGPAAHLFDPGIGDMEIGKDFIVR